MEIFHTSWKTLNGRYHDLLAWKMGQSSVSKFANGTKVGSVVDASDELQR